MTLLAVKNPYDDGVDDLATLHGISMPKLNAERILADVAPCVTPFRAAQSAPTGEGSILVIEAGGKGVRMVRPASKEPRPKMRRKKGEKHNKKKMALGRPSGDAGPLSEAEPDEDEGPQHGAQEEGTARGDRLPARRAVSGALRRVLERRLPIATGSVEGACRHLIVDRMERSGMRWEESRAKAILDLRAVHLNGEWDEFWRFRIGQEHNRLYG